MFRYPNYKLLSRSSSASNFSITVQSLCHKPYLLLSAASVLGHPPVFYVNPLKNIICILKLYTVEIPRVFIM